MSDTTWLCAAAVSATIGWSVGAAIGQSVAGKVNHVVVPIVDLTKQTRILEDGSREAAYIPADTAPPTTLFPGVTTLYEAVRHGRARAGDGPMLGVRKSTAGGWNDYEWTGYREAIARSERLAQALRALAVPIGQETRIALCSQNRPEWTLVDMATHCFSNVLVPLYHTLSPDELVFIIGHTECAVAAVDSVAKCKALIKAKKRKRIPHLDHIIVFDEFKDVLAHDGRAVDVEVHSMHALEELGRTVPPLTHRPPASTDLSTICYTAGTCGAPKGVLLTHANMMASQVALAYIGVEESGKPGIQWFSQKDVLISHMSLAHTLSRLIETTLFSIGACVGYYSGNMLYLEEDIRVLRPTILPVAPMILNRMRHTVYKDVSKRALFKGLFKTLFKMAVWRKKLERKEGIVRDDGVLDRWFFSSFRQMVGGRVRLVINGTGYLNENTVAFSRAVFGCTVLECYGLAECGGAAAMTLRGEWRSDHVGAPVPHLRIKLVDAPHLGFYAKDGIGEICIRGRSVTPGYYKNPMMTADNISNGWLYTGDVGVWTETGCLRYSDRIKNIFQLAKGGFISPERIEQIYTRCRYVEQCYVHYSFNNDIVALVVPDRENLRFYCSAEGIPGTINENCRDEKVTKMVHAAMCKTGAREGLKEHEQVTQIRLLPTWFSIDNGCLSPTLNLRRNKITKRFQDEIEEMRCRNEEESYLHNL